MRRRDFIAGLGAAGWPFTRSLAAEEQRRVGALLNLPENHPLSQSAVVVFREGLATFGWVEGRNLRIDYRSETDPHRAAIRQSEDRYEGEERPGQHLPAKR